MASSAATARMIGMTGMLGLVGALGAALAGCGDADPAPAVASAPAAPPNPSATPAAAPSPGAHADPHGPGGLMAVPPPVARTAQGKIELTIDGTPQRIGFLPFGRNAAIWVEKTGVSRITIGGSESDERLPRFSIQVTGIKLDDVELPVTISAGASGKGKAPTRPTPRITWQVGEKRIYRSQDDAEDGAAQVVLTSYSGGRLTGSFQGKLVMGDGKLDPPLNVIGNFDVTLRLNGVAPDRATDRP